MALRVLGVPSAAGAYGNGVALAPRALREARLLEGLSERGVEVADSGDLRLVPFTPDPANPKQQNIEKVIEVASEVAATWRRSARPAMCRSSWAGTAR
jgi:arginase